MFEIEWFSMGSQFFYLYIIKIKRFVVENLIFVLSTYLVLLQVFAVTLLKVRRVDL